MKTTLMTLVISAALLFAGCSNPVDNGKNETPFTVVKSAVVDRETEPVAAELLTTEASSINTFSIKMYSGLVENDKNFFFSPYSITSALAMTSAGADSSTKDQILAALQNSLVGVQFDQALNGLDLDLMSYAHRTDGVTLSIANSTWIQSGWDFSIGYLNHISQYYGAGINLLDFQSAPEPSRTIINDWVAKQTNDKILNLLPEGSVTANTALVLTNAVYFLANWQTSFNKEYTKDVSFRKLDKTSIDVPTMYPVEPGKKTTMRYARMSRVRALDFPYKGDRFVMTVLLPDKDSFPEFEQSLSAPLLDTLFSKLAEKELMVSLPKFSFTWGSKSLRQQLMALGMVDAFSEATADFSTLGGPRKLFVSDVVHKAFVAVDENGTEAAAATGVIIGTTSVDPDPVIFLVDRPFIFVIRDRETGTILFMGRILNPLDKA